MARRAKTTDLPTHRVRAQNKLIGSVPDTAIFEEQEPIEGRFSKMKLEEQLQIPVATRKKKELTIKPKQIQTQNQPKVLKPAEENQFLQISG